MKFFLKFSANAFAILLLGMWCSAQIAPPPAPKPALQKGRAKVYYSERSNVTAGSVQSYIKGSIDGDYRGEDAIRLNANYGAPGKPPVSPEYVEFWIQFASKSEPKFKENHKIKIFADDQPLASEDPEPLYSRPQGWNVNVETYTIARMPYPIFRALARSRRAVIQIGETRLTLPEAVLEDLRSLDDTIKQ